MACAIQIYNAMLYFATEAASNFDDTTGLDSVSFWLIFVLVSVVRFMVPLPIFVYCWILSVRAVRVLDAQTLRGRNNPSASRSSTPSMSPTSSPKCSPAQPLHSLEKAPVVVVGMKCQGATNSSPEKDERASIDLDDNAAIEDDGRGTMCSEDRLSLYESASEEPRQTWFQQKDL